MLGLTLLQNVNWETLVSPNLLFLQPGEMPTFGSLSRCFPDNRYKAIRRHNN